MKYLPYIICFFILSCGKSAKESHTADMGGVSKLLLLGTEMSRVFSFLPLKGKVKDQNKYWSSDYWPLKRGSINYRWNAENPTGINLQSPNKNEIVSMSLKQLGTLSPAEKFDLFNGDYQFTLKKEVASTVNPLAQAWEGICNGWAAAAINHQEPLPKILLNPDGIKIPFGTSDIKALLSYYYAHNKSEDAFHNGFRCEGHETGDLNCKEDLNAGTFHIILTNKVGQEGAGIIADIERYKEVWNHPITSYDTLIIQDQIPPEEFSVSGTTRIVRVVTEVFYTNSVPENTWGPVIGTKFQKNISRFYEYTLELNSQDEIIGGRWVSQDRPDFLWIKSRPKKFSGHFHRLGELLNDH